MTVGSEDPVAAISADQGRETKVLSGNIAVGAINQVIAAGEMIAKHLLAAPAGTTIGDLLTQKV
ncbi:hypothetical protein ACGYLI_00040 [Sulfitobacter sp. 1A13421]|uniref:hypothetical protein n=1 Tax=Sulfitobacter sp. 1A13421 TaxID=3368595 RepID=UPI0037469180